MAFTPIIEYPAVPGNKYDMLVDIGGPSSYTVITTATPPTGGQTIKASDIGFQSIDFAVVCGSDNGQYTGVAYVNTGSSGLGNPAKQAGTQIQLQWITAATGAEVTGTTNVSARTLRLFVRGR